MKYKHHEIVEMLYTNKIEDKTIIHMLNTNDGTLSHYFIYTAIDKRFHRCNFEGKILHREPKTIRFISYYYFDKLFEIIEEPKEVKLPEKINEEHHETETEDIVAKWTPGEQIIVGKLNTLIDYLKAKEERESEK